MNQLLRIITPFVYFKLSECRSMEENVGTVC